MNETDINAYQPTRALHQRHMFNLMDYSAEDLYEILLYAAALKKRLQTKGSSPRTLKGRTVAIMLEGRCTRLRAALEQATHQLGGHALVLDRERCDLARNESVHDTARALAEYGIHAVVMRTAMQADLVDLAKYGNFSVVNGRTLDFDPIQALADYLTIYEQFGHLRGLKVCYLGTGNAVCHSLMIAGAKLGVHVAVCTPAEYAPHRDVTAYAAKFSDVKLTQDIPEAVHDADVIYTTEQFADGETEDPIKRAALAPYRATVPMFKTQTHADCIFLHPMPATRDAEATSNVVDAPYSQTTRQAGNLLHVSKALLSLLPSDKKAKKI